jgi:hypothetical protein
MLETTNGVRPGRSEQDGILREGLSVVFGGETFRLRPLVWERSDIWFALVKRKLGDLAGNLFASGDLASFEEVLTGTTGAQLDLLIEYDETGALRDREWFRKNASKREIFDAFLLVLEYEQPPLDLARRLLPAEVRTPILTRLIAAGLSASVASSSAPSPPGATARPPRSKRR